MIKEVVFGRVYEDQVSGFRGVAVGYADYITGRPQALLQPRGTASKKLYGAEWIECVRLLLVDEIQEVLSLDIPISKHIGYREPEKS